MLLDGLCADVPDTSASYIRRSRIESKDMPQK